MKMFIYLYNQVLFFAWVYIDFMGGLILILHIFRLKMYIVRKIDTYHNVFEIKKQMLDIAFLVNSKGQQMMN